MKSFRNDLVVAPSEASSKNKINETQRQVEEITEIMRINMQNIVERDLKLSELERRADGIEESSKLFKKTTVELKKKYWWKDKKILLIIIITATILILIIGFSIYMSI